MGCKGAAQAARKARKRTRDRANDNRDARRRRSRDRDASEARRDHAGSARPTRRRARAPIDPRLAAAGGLTPRVRTAPLRVSSDTDTRETHADQNRRKPGVRGTLGPVVTGTHEGKHVPVSEHAFKRRNRRDAEAQGRRRRSFNLQG
jgi:hypothetical protein